MQIVPPNSNNTNTNNHEGRCPATLCVTVSTSSSSRIGCQSRLGNMQHVTFGGKFVILDQLEASNLYTCIDTKSREQFVCKVLPSRSYKEQLAGYLRLAGNPGINQIEEVIIEPKQTFVLFKSAFGDLHSHVRSKKKLDQDEAIELFRQVTEIVNDCHENGICLRDLKLRKFVFQDPQKTKLKLETLDDAVVLEDPEDDSLGEKHGCPAYVSPEILTTDSRYSGKSADCWSLGVILFTMLAGRYPFHDPNPSSLIGKIRRGHFHVPNNLSKEIKCIISSLLRKNPSERMTTQDLLSSHLFKEDSERRKRCSHTTFDDLTHTLISHHHHHHSYLHPHLSSSHHLPMAIMGNRRPSNEHDSPPCIVPDLLI